MATSDAPLNVPNVTLAVARGSGSPPIGSLQLVAETGFSITGQVADLAEVIISGQDFGTKAPQRHFDRIDRYWKNGTEVVDPYSGLTDGADLPTTMDRADAPFIGRFAHHMDNWKLRAEGARQGRSLGYQLESDINGRLEGVCTDGFAGWPISQRDAENIYVRHWRFMLYPPTDKTLDLDPTTGNGGDAVLKNSLASGATQLELAVIPDNARFGEGFGYEFYLKLDDGSLQRFTETSPYIKNQGTIANFTPPLPSPASAGNPVYIRSNAAHKELRIRDQGVDRPWNAYAFAGYQDSTSNHKWDRRQDRPFVAWQEGVWELWEHYTVAPKTEVEVPEGVRMFTRINGRVVLDVKNRTSIVAYTENSLNGGVEYDTPGFEGWPSTGCAVTLYGYEEDRPHFIPGNKFRLSDTYVDNSRRRVEIGIGSDDLYQCMPRECCPIKTWSNSITVNLNALPFTESELSQARVFVVDEDDTATLVGRIQ